jgi:4-hydroxy-tetrahydrodipicolinate reductase
MSISSASAPIHVAVLGAAGRMGQTVVQAVEAAEDMAMVLACDIGWTPGLLAEAEAGVAVDFTVPAAAESNVHSLIDLGVHAVVGTTGWTAEALDRVRAHLGPQPKVGVLVAPNFAIGAVLAGVFAGAAARYFESAEVVELHHPDKADAPSGTAIHAAQAIAAARASAQLPPMPDATRAGLPGARGASGEGVHIHSVRLRGLLAHEEILLGNPGELLTIRHDSLDRASFMPGVLLAVREVAAHPGLTLGLEGYLRLDAHFAPPMESPSA